MTKTWTPRNRALTWFLALFVLAFSVSLAFCYATYDPAPPRISVRWGEHITPSQRVALQAAYGLAEPKYAQGTTWSYGSLYTSTDNIQRLVQDPAVDDTHMIDRGTFELSEPPPAPLFVFLVLSSTIGIAVASFFAFLALSGDQAEKLTIQIHERRQWNRGARGHLGSPYRDQQYGDNRQRRAGAPLRLMLYRLVPYVLISAGMQIAIALWVPVERSVQRTYLDVNLFENVQPRALVGTLSHYLSLSDSQFLILTQIALFTWLLTLALLIATPQEKREHASLDWQLRGLVFIFAFSTVPFITNAFSGFVDIFAAVAVISCVWLLRQRDQSSPLAVVGVVLLLCLATLIHEKSVFEALILLAWMVFTRERKQAVSAVALYALFLGGYLYLYLSAGTEIPGYGITSAQYLSGMAQFQSFWWDRSFNVLGIVFGGGFLWVLYAWLAVLFIRVRQARGNPFSRSTLVVGMLGLCLAPMFVAWDTTRLVAIIWLPTLLLFRELDFSAYRAANRFTTVSLVAACLLQALVPPVLVYQHRAIALNCYASLVVGHLERAQDPDFDDWPLPLTLRLHTDRTDVSELYGCAPIYLTRP